MKSYLALLNLVFTLLISFGGKGQGPADTSLSHLQSLSGKYAVQVQTRTQVIASGLQNETSRYLGKLSSLENRILTKLQKLRPGTPVLTPSSYDKLFGAPIPVTYVGGLDTCKTSLAFLGQRVALNQVGQLQGTFNQAALANQYITSRRQQLAQLLSGYSDLTNTITRAFNRYKETAYYYKRQVQAYKDMLSDRGKLESHTLSILEGLPVFQRFFSQHSALSSLFAPPTNGGMGAATLPVSLSNLQTRSSVEGLIQQKIAVAGPGIQVSLQQDMEAAQGKLSSLRQQITQFGSGGAEMDLPPGFQPNQQKTKTFLKRLEYGANVQFAQSMGYYFPATANLALTLGYKLNDKSTVGAGLAYFMGMGSGWNNIQLSNQGIGLRSFMDWRIKKSYFVISGFEENYMSQFAGIQELKNVSWQKSVLIGFERKYKISAKLQGNIQALFDVLYKTEVPAGQMIKFRVGYNF